ncbi:hypothetical protein C172_09494 [Paenibacillus sp. FSL H8-457]|nr:hypothetical protein C172_09494 [Paenibacillus sp. FSL H8-457]
MDITASHEKNSASDLAGFFAVDDHPSTWIMSAARTMYKLFRGAAREARGCVDGSVHNIEGMAPNE